MAKRKTLNKILASFMLVLFIFYYANNNLFLHEHVINGVTIVHSHFHNDRHHSHKSGDHTTNDVDLIVHLSNFQSLSPTFFNPDCTLLVFETNIITKKIEKEKNLGYVGFISLRAPPAI